MDLATQLVDEHDEGRWVERIDANRKDDPSSHIARNWAKISGQAYTYCGLTFIASEPRPQLGAGKSCENCFRVFTSRHGLIIPAATPAPEQGVPVMDAVGEGIPVEPGTEGEESVQGEGPDPLE